MKTKKLENRRIQTKKRSKREEKKATKKEIFFSGKNNEPVGEFVGPESNDTKPTERVIHSAKLAPKRHRSHGKRPEEARTRSGPTDSIESSVLSRKPTSGSSSNSSRSFPGPHAADR